MILITGGRGAIATNLLILLHDRGHPVRVASTSPHHLELPDDVAAVRLNLTDPTTFTVALAGATSVFLYASAEHIAELVQEAVTAGVSHIVLLSSASVLGPDPDNDPLARAHLDVERALLASPISTTILRPGSFSSNVRSWAWPIRSGRAVSLPYPGSHTDPIHDKDVAETAFAVLTDPRHRGGQFLLSGPETMTFSEQIRRLGQATGQSIEIASITRERWKQEMADYISGPYADALLDFWSSTSDKPPRLTTSVEELTGHPARTFTAWAQEHANEFIG